jgi:hypothetical protein
MYSLKCLGVRERVSELNGFAKNLRKYGVVFVSALALLLLAPISVWGQNVYGPLRERSRLAAARLLLAQP